MPSNFHRPLRHRPGTAGMLFLRFWGNTDRLSQLHFFYMLLAALILHLTAYGIWLLIPKTPVIDIPVRALNIKLGDSEDIPDQEPAPAAKDNSSSVENIIAKVAKDAQNDAARNEAMVKAMEKAIAPEPKKPAPVKAARPAPQAKPFDMRSEGVAVAAPVMSVVEKQYVREAAPSAEGSKLGTSTSTSAEIMSRYEQQISAWIDRFKPAKLMAAGQPDRVTASIRIRIDKRGNIRYMQLEQSTGFVVLDHAAIDTVRRANPVPPAPADYPADDSIEFIVPVVFTK